MSTKNLGPTPKTSRRGSQLQGHPRTGPGPIPPETSFSRLLAHGAVPLCTPATHVPSIVEVPGTLACRANFQGLSGSPGTRHQALSWPQGRTPWDLWIRSKAHRPPPQAGLWQIWQRACPHHHGGPAETGERAPPFHPGPGNRDMGLRDPLQKAPGTLSPVGERPSPACAHSPGSLRGKHPQPPSARAPQGPAGERPSPSSAQAALSVEGGAALAGGGGLRLPYFLGVSAPPSGRAGPVLVAVGERPSLEASSPPCALGPAGERPSPGSSQCAQGELRVRASTPMAWS